MDLLLQNSKTHSNTVLEIKEFPKNNAPGFSKPLSVADEDKLFIFKRFSNSLTSDSVIELHFSSIIMMELRLPMNKNKLTNLRFYPKTN